MRWVLLINAHIRIRMLLAVAVIVIGCGVYAVTDVQRASDAASFEEYASWRELRGAALSVSLAFDQASLHGTKAAAEVEAAERDVLLTTVAAEPHLDRRDGPKRDLGREQIKTAAELAELAGLALTLEPNRPGGGTGELEARRGVALDRFLAANDRLLATLAGERREAGRSATRRPVLLVLVLFVLFGLLHVVFVERPAKRGRSRRHAQAEFGDAIQVARSESEAYDLIAHHVKRASRAVEVTVLNRNNSADRLEAVTPVEPGGATAEGLEGATPASCLAIRLARPHHRSPGDERLLRCDVCGRSANRTTCVPALVGGEVIGAVLVEHAQSLGRESRGVIEQSVAEAAPVVANLRNLAVAELRAATDGLTGLANQRTVHETLKRAAAQAGRTTSPLALVIFDLDRFKAVNDTYGHGKGDDVLAAVGAVAASTVRGSDFVGRLGGEEFAILLPDTDRAGALHVAEKLRAEIATLSIPGVDRRITASFGVAVMPDDAGEPDLLLRAADRALYAAKNAGRDRVETTTGPDHVQPELAAHAERD